jgi:uncharacterized membrane protein YqhA
MLRKILAGSRYFIIIPVICSFLSAVAVFVYGMLVTWTIDFEAFTAGIFTDKEVKHLSLAFITLIDLFLLGTVLYIIALGLYLLFVDKKLPMPSWLIIDDLDDLKTQLIKIIMVLLAVTFLANAVTWTGNINILYLGIAISLVLFALGALTGYGSMSHRTQSHNKDIEKVE